MLLKKSSIFLSNISVVDHAYVNDKGVIIGGSFNPSFIVTGKIDPNEKVVVDFSTIKKSIKTLIDQHTWNPYNNGFDHKIWWIEGYSKGTIEKHDHAERYIITTPAVKLEVPTDALKIIAPITSHSSQYSIDYIGQSMKLFLDKELAKIYPNVEIEVDCYNNTDVHLIKKSKPYQYFTYSHGLKDSTSYGCQNIAHGHLSFIQHSDDDKIFRIAQDLNNVVFINKENVVEDLDDWISISYTTKRGLFKAEYNKKMCKYLVLDTETTIELIAEYVKDVYHISDFYISEGLSEGTYLNV